MTRRSSVANYAKSHPKKTFIIGTAGSQDPTLQIAPKNVFRYHGDGAQWNAGIGEIAYKKLRLAEGGDHHGRLQLRLDVRSRHDRRLLRDGRQDHEAGLPAAEHADYAPYIRQLPPPDAVDGYFWVVGGTGDRAASLKAYEQAYGKPNPKKFIGNLFFAFLGNFKEVAPRLVGAYVGGFGTSPGLKTKPQTGLRREVAKSLPGPERRELRRRLRLQLLQRGAGRWSRA